MTVPTARAIARGTLWASLAFNGALVVVDLTGRHYEAAGGQSVVLVVLATWLWLLPKIDGLLDAKRAEAIAQRAVAEIALQEVQFLQRSGQLRIGVSVEGPTERRH